MAAALGQDLHDPSVTGEGDVVVLGSFHELAVADLEHGAEPVAVRLVGAEQAEAVRVAGVDVA